MWASLPVTRDALRLAEARTHTGKFRSAQEILSHGSKCDFDGTHMRSKVRLHTGTSQPNDGVKQILATMATKAEPSRLP